GAGARAPGLLSTEADVCESSVFAVIFAANGLPEPLAAACDGPPASARFAGTRATMASIGPNPEPVDISCSDFLISPTRSFEAKSSFEEFPAGLPAGGEAARLRASESLAAFRLRARIAAAAAAGLAATRRETSTTGVFFGAAAGLRCAGLVTEAGLAVLPETDFAFARADASRLAPAARASTGLALLVAPFFAARIVLLARGTARSAKAFFLAAGLAATARFPRAAATAVLVFVPREDLLAARFLAASARAAAARFALNTADGFDAFALAVPGCFALVVLFACLVLDDFMVFLTIAMISVLLFPVPLWRRDSSRRRTNPQPFGNSEFRPGKGAKRNAPKRRSSVHNLAGLTQRDIFGRAGEELLSPHP
ncbi:MAG: hypothetical protein ACREC9_06695, partial [Methylocella sp.]